MVISSNLLLSDSPQAKFQAKKITTMYNFMNIKEKKEEKTNRTQFGRKPCND